jgi:outer membrane protein assembly factor BamB
MPSGTRLLKYCASLLFALVAGSWASAENWPQWRGTKLDGVSNEKGLPVKWSKTEGVVWRVPMPGEGGSTPVVWDDRVFVTSADGKDLALICVGTDGKKQWRKTVATGNKKVRDDEGNAASPSCSTDGKHVWTFMATGDLACFTVEGEEVWKFNVQDRYGKLKIQFGMTSTPVLDGDRLYVQLIHGEGNPETREATIAALDAATGKEVWKVGRDSDAYDECEHSYASPVIYRDDKQAFLLTHGADYVVAHRLEDGKEIWRCGNLNLKDRYNNTLRFVASPVAVPGMIVVPSAKNGPVLALKPDGKGDITESQASYHWTRKSNTPDVPSPLVKDGIVYLCRENGVLIAVDAANGKEHYQQRVHLTRHRASPVYADGHVYLVARDGTVNIIAAGPEFKIVSTIKMGEEMSASPAISNGRIYLRTFDALYAVGEK